MQSLERGLAVIRAFDAEHRELALSDVARSTGLTRAAARRFLLTLVKLGYVNFSQGRFSLRPRVLELGYAYLSSLSLPEVALPHMEALVAEVNESCSISVLDDTDIVYVARVPTRRIMSITLAVGTRLPAFVTSMGRVLLAGLPDDELAERLERIEVVPLTAHTVTDKDALGTILETVRRQGYAATDQELEEGLRSLAVPLRNASGNVTAALNLSVHASRASMAALRRDFLPLALRAAAAIEEDLTGTGDRRGGSFALPEAVDPPGQPLEKARISYGRGFANGSSGQDGGCARGCPTVGSHGLVAQLNARDGRTGRIRGPRTDLALEIAKTEARCLLSRWRVTWRASPTRSCSSNTTKTGTPTLATSSSGGSSRLRASWRSATCIVASRSTTSFRSPPSGC